MLCACKARTLTALTVAVAMVIGIQAIHGQDAPGRVAWKKTATKTTPLGVRHFRIQKMMQELEHKLESLAATLAKTEPEQAKRLGDALRESKKMRLTDRMSLITTLLNDTQLKRASKQQKTLLDELKKLVEILAKEEKDPRIPDFERQIGTLKDIIAGERWRLGEGKNVANPAGAIRDLEAMIARLKLLIKREKDVLASTLAQRLKGIEALPKIADQQHIILKDTQRLALDLGGGKLQAKVRGQEALHGATKHQQDAEENLASGKGKAAQGDEKKAIEDMETALAQLQKERGRIAKLPPDAIKRIAALEKEGADNAGKLAKSMGKNGSKPGGAKKAPGQAKIEEGRKSQNAAAGKLGKNNPGGAAGDQREAIKKFNEAKRELEERLAQLREEMQLESLAALESRFRNMLEQQRPLSQATAAFDRKYPDRTKRERPQHLRIGSFVKEERTLAEQAQAALDIIVEDGTSVIFPKIVGQLRDDLRGVAALLEKGHTGSYTQSQQKEIERTLEELIAAVKKAQEQSDSKPGKSGKPGKPSGPPEPPPLLPDSAELKLLKSAQLRVNRRTEQFDVVRPGADSLDGVLREEIRNIADRQQDVATTTEQIVENY